MDPDPDTAVFLLLGFGNIFENSGGGELCRERVRESETSTECSEVEHKRNGLRNQKSLF